MSCSILRTRSSAASYTFMGNALQSFKFQSIIQPHFRESMGYFIYNMGMDKVHLMQTICEKVAFLMGLFIHMYTCTHTFDSLDHSGSSFFYPSFSSILFALIAAYIMFIYQHTSSIYVHVTLTLTFVLIANLSEYLHLYALYR